MSSQEQQQPVAPANLEGPTPPSVDAGNPFTTLPPGWTTAADPRDGRLYYWHAATKRSSWTHPSAAFDGMNANAAITSTNTPLPPQNNNNNNNNNASVFDYFAAPTSTSSPTTRNNKTRTQPQPPPPMSNNGAAAPGDENPYMASRRPDNHQCGAIAALFLCFPLGIFALYHSIRVDQCWKSGQYSDAFIHSRQSPQFSSWGIMIGIVFWVCWFFFRRGRGEWEWPDWNFGD